jgi:hypothetical protein
MVLTYGFESEEVDDNDSDSERYRCVPYKGEDATTELRVATQLRNVPGIVCRFLQIEGTINAIHTPGDSS